MKVILYSLLGLLFLFSCKSDNSNQSSTNKSSQTKPAKKPMTALAEKLYANFVADPKTQDQKDENALIEYAIDNNLDAKRTQSGLYYVIEEKGVGPNLINGQPTQVHYNGAFLDGKIFDSSYNRNKPIQFTVGQMNAGWNEGLLYMNTGTKAKLLIPSKLAYGARGFPGYVPPHTPIMFDMHVLPIGQ